MENKITASKKFKDGFRIHGQVGVFFLLNAELGRKIKNERIINVPYVAYSDHYEKYYEDLSYWSIENLEKLSESMPKEFAKEFDKKISEIRLEWNKALNALECDLPF